MSHEMTVVQRVRTHGAAIDRNASMLASQFLNSFFAACPHLAARLKGEHHRQCRVFAQRWAWFVRHLAHMDQVSPELEAIGAYLAARGMVHTDYTAARLCLLEALRNTSQASEVAWGPLQESAWAATLDTCLHMVCPVQTVSSYARAA